MDVIAVVLFALIFSGWGIWVSQRGEGRDYPRRDRRSTDAVDAPEPGASRNTRDSRQHQHETT